jgi:hypothetical protein
MATASASVASSGTPSITIPSRRATIAATCSLSAAPLPQIACFTSLGVGSSTTSPASAAARRATPRACPTAMAVCTLR